MTTPLEFEQPIAELESKLVELRHLSSSKDFNISKEVERLEDKVRKLLHQTYSRLTPWQKVLVARHPERPHCLDFIGQLIEDFVELAGDRAFAEDKAVIGGLGRFRGQPVMVMGTEKGHDVESRLLHNFGMPRPEGYRKARRLVHLANDYKLPILTFVDTAGAHPGKDAEERGQSEAIARSIEAFLKARVPVIATVTGEGGSGGAIALAVANEVLMLEHAIYSVVTPEGCASILWRSADRKQDAAAAQKLTAQDLKALQIIDCIIPEPLGGAQRSPKSAIAETGDAIEKALKNYLNDSPEGLHNHRRQKFLTMGQLGLS
ncbi:MAG: acetyl-CoA carboxylase carboxyltransferase subunit alpha [Caedimonas sp.]|nr:acetyl-CoA carboxylase carboxyltransferase subunit alpha [Caedimonas sp.]